MLKKKTPAMGFGNTPSHAQPQANSFAHRASGKKWLKYTCLNVLRNAHAVIADQNSYGFLSIATLDLHHPSRRCCLSIHKQIHEALLKIMGVTAQVR